MIPPHSCVVPGRKPGTSTNVTSGRLKASQKRTKCATPDFDACVAAPPSSSNVTSSPVTVFTTSGPVMNMYDVPSTMKTKSVMAGEYTAPPAQGPITSESCGITPEQLALPALALDRRLGRGMLGFLAQLLELLELRLRGIPVADRHDKRRL